MGTNDPQIDADWVGEDGRRRIKCYPAAADHDFIDGGNSIDPEPGETLDATILVTPGFEIPVRIEVDDLGDPWNDGKEYYAYGEIDFAPAVELFRDEIGGELPAELEPQARDRLDGLADHEVDVIVEALK